MFKLKLLILANNIYCNNQPSEENIEYSRKEIVDKIAKFFFYNKYHMVKDFKEKNGKVVYLKSDADETLLTILDFINHQENVHLFWIEIMYALRDLYSNK